MAPKTSDIRKVDVAKMVLCQLLSDVVTFDPGMLPLRRRVIHKWGAPIHESGLRIVVTYLVPRWKVTLKLGFNPNFRVISGILRKTPAIYFCRCQ